MWVEAYLLSYKLFKCLLVGCLSSLVYINEVLSYVACIRIIEFVMNKSKLFDSDVKHQRRIPECSRNDYIEKIRGKIQENNYKLLGIMFTSWQSELGVGGSVV